MREYICNDDYQGKKKKGWEIMSRKSIQKKNISLEGLFY